MRGRFNRHGLRRRAHAALDPNARQVIRAAAILEISGYELLALAYREWYGRAPRTHDLGVVFGPYMFHGKTPFWAVVLARQVIGLHDAGQLAESRSVLLLVVFGLLYYGVAGYQPPR